MSQVVSKSSARAASLRLPPPEVLFIEGSDFETFPAGGQLAMARSLLKIFGSRLALVGIGRADTPVGDWIEQEIDGVRYWFFAVCRRSYSARRPLVPARLQFFAGLKRYKSRILELGCRSAFIQAPEGLMATCRWHLDSVCFMFPGVENQFRISRYGLARTIAPAWDMLMRRSLRAADVILACADETAIQDLLVRYHGELQRHDVVQLPTCVDLEEFKPSDVTSSRIALNLPQDRIILVTNGRIGRFKGWSLLVDALDALRHRRPDILLVFVGDGEDRPALEAYVAHKNLGDFVRVTGYQKHKVVAQYLNAGNLAVFGSLAEGWSVAMLEALACGKAMVSTKVSGTDQMIVPGRNGCVVSSRDPEVFANAVEYALSIQSPELVSTSIAARYSLDWMGQKLQRLWAPLRDSEQ